MSHVPHELAEEFPDQKDEINALRARDGHFSRLVDKYHEVNRAIHRAETNVEPTDDYHMIEMRKTRLRLKDDIAASLAEA
jgi:uncharacterized protein YdcH (DUF465 family)